MRGKDGTMVRGTGVIQTRWTSILIQDLADVGGEYWYMYLDKYRNLGNLFMRQDIHSFGLLGN